VIRRAISLGADHAHPVLRRLSPQGPPDLFKYWRDRRSDLCDGRFIGWAGEFAHIRDLVLDFSKCRHARKPRAVIGDGSEFEHGHCEFERGCLQLEGLGTRFSYELPGHMAHWVDSLVDCRSVRIDVEHSDVFLAIARYEYANLFHVLADLYYAFLVLRFLRIEPRSVTVLLMDRHPSCPLDAFVETMFGGVKRIDDLRGVHRFKNMIFSPLGHRGPMAARFQKYPYLIEDFARHTLRAFGLEPRRTRKVRRLTIVRRRDYDDRVECSGSPVRRRIVNEDALIASVGRAFDGADVAGVRFEELGVAAQLRCVSETDILVGMHGAGLAHALFLPANGGLLELFPRYYSVVNDHYYNIAYWRRLHYARWKNRSRRLELGGIATYVPPREISRKLGRLVAAIEAHG
jgi:glycoprotein 2-beta-D-xylosyltransferase